MSIIINRKTSKYISLLLVFVLLFTGFACILSHQSEAYANPAIAIQVIELVAWVLGLLGITFASVSAQNTSAEQAYADIPELKAWADKWQGAIELQSGAWVFKVGKVALKELADNVIPKVKAYFTKSKTSIPVKDVANIRYGDCLVMQLNEGATVYYQNCPYGWTDEIKMTLNGVEYRYKPTVSVAYGAYGVELYVNGQVKDCWECGIENPHWGDSNNYEYGMKWGFIYNLYNGISSIRPIATSFAKNKNTGLYEYYNNTVKYIDTALPGNYIISDNNLTYGTKQIPYNHVIDYVQTELQNALKQIADKLSDVATIDVGVLDPYNDITKAREGAEAVPTTDWAQIWDALGIKDLIKTLVIANEDVAYKPNPSGVPNIGGTWAYVTTFVGSALIWMQLWYTGFTMLPAPLKSTLWAILVITIFTGVLGVFLK